MKEVSNRAVRILKADAGTMLKSKDEEYAYWQGRPPLERLVAMQELSFAMFVLKDAESDLRQRMFENPRCLPCPWLDEAGAGASEPKA